MIMLQRHEAIAVILNCLTHRELVVLANGLISREGFSCRDHPQNFYMLGSMGLAGAIGLGVALADPFMNVVVLDGDGNLLMGLGLLPMVGAWQPLRFIHIVLDNCTYGSTGGQPTVAPFVQFPELAVACGYRRATSVEKSEAVEAYMREWLIEPGPSLLHIRISNEETTSVPRVRHEPPHIAKRFALAMQERRTEGSG